MAKGKGVKAWAIQVEPTSPAEVIKTLPLFRLLTKPIERKKRK